jgi:photosystem II stability/assembly factor-like uncharacterized protein
MSWFNITQGNTHRGVTVDETGTNLVSFAEYTDVSSTGVTLPIYSTDSGATWAQSTGFPTGYAQYPTYTASPISSSSSGQYVLVSVLDSNTNLGTAYSSSNYGASFTAISSLPAGITSVNLVSINSTGSVWCVSANDPNYGTGNLYLSFDYGVTWTADTTSLGAPAWSNVRISTTGQYILAVSNQYQSVTAALSTDYGVTWSTIPTITASDQIGLISMSDSGQYMYLEGVYGVYKSDDYGTTWTTFLSGGNNTYYPLPKTTGSVFVYLNVDTQVWYYTTNYGNNWNSIDTSSYPPSADLIISNNGSKIFIISNGSLVYQYLSPSVSPSTLSQTWLALGGNQLLGFNAMNCTSNGQYIVGVNQTITFSTDYGQTFNIATTPELANNSTKSFAVTSNGQTIYVGGINYTVLKSTDYGATFTYITTGYEGSTFSGFTCDSNGTNIYGLMSMNGIVVSNNGGSTWTNTASSINYVIWTNCVCSSDGTYVYASGIAAGTTGLDVLYISSNHGATWTLATMPVQMYPPIIRWVTCDSTGQYVVIACGQHGIYRSSNHGTTWTALSTGVIGLEWASIASDASGSKLIASENTQQCAYISSNSGSTWTVLNMNVTSINLQYPIVAMDSSGTYQFISSNYIPITLINQFSSSANTGGWTLNKSIYHTQIAIASNNLNMAAIKYETNVSKIDISTNGGITWTTQSSPDNSNVFCVAISSDGQYVYYGGNSLYKSSDYGLTFSTIADYTVYGNIRAIACDLTGNYVYMTTFNNDIAMSFIYHSSDGGISFSQATLADTSYHLCCNSTGQYVYYIVENDPSNLYTSMDYGYTYTAVSLPTGSNPIICNGAGNKLYTQDGSGNVWVSSDYAVTWTQTSLTSQPIINTMSCDLAGNRMITVGSFNNIHITTDSGNTWTNYSLLGGLLVPQAFGGTGVSISPDGTLYYASAAIPGTYSQTIGTPDIPDPVPCFLEGTPILCLINGVDTYVPVENIKPGTRVKTSRDGYKRVVHIGYRKMINSRFDERNQNCLYRCTKDKYPQLLGDITITGCHAILVDDITPVQRQGIMKVLQRIYVTEQRYRLPACIDERATVVQQYGEFTVWHFALDHPDVRMNYGVYANGLLVESSSIYHMERKNYTLIK